MCRQAHHKRRGKTTTTKELIMATTTMTSTTTTIPQTPIRSTTTYAATTTTPLIPLTPAPPCSPVDPLSSLPVRIHVMILPYLSNHAIHCLERTCRFWWATCATSPPPLLAPGTRLYPHQIHAIMRVRARELPHFMHDGQGAILCHEPGLGKSLTTLCEVMRTWGMLPVPNDEFAPNPYSDKRPSPLRQLLLEEFTRSHNLPLHGGTLLVVPKPLVSHWRTQLAKHCPRLPCKFVDDDAGINPLDFPRVALFVVTFARLSQEMLRRGTANSVFSAVKWLRLVVDEGHALESQSRTSYGEFLNKIQSERRLLLTGTPTKRLLLSDTESLRTLLELLNFVRSNAAATQLELAMRRLTSMRSSSLDEETVLQITHNVMIRHTKNDIVDSLPRLVRHVERLEFDQNEKRVYNTLVSFVRANIMLTSIGKGGRQQSLLHPSQRKYAMELLRNLRIACCTVTRMRLILTDKNLTETRQLIQARPNWTEEQIARAETFMDRAKRWEDSQCDHCGRNIPLLIILECAHFLCVDCFGDTAYVPGHDSDPDDAACGNCVICAAPIPANSLAAFQPGFELAFEEDALPNVYSSKEKWLLAKLENPPPQFKGIVFSQFRSMLNVVGTALLNRFGVDYVAEFWGQYQQQELAKYVKGVVNEWTCNKCQRICTDVLKSSCGGIKWDVLVFDPPPQPAVAGGDGAGAGAAAQPPEPTRRAVRINRPDLVVENYNDQMGIGHQFRYQGRDAQIQSVVKCRGLVRDSGGWKQRNVNTPVLLLGRDGSTGLDLSMTNHVFLMDQLWDAALDQQVVSRAWRIGNTAKEVIVEQLVMSGTIEDLMVQSGVMDIMSRTSSSSSSSSSTCVESSMVSEVEGNFSRDEGRSIANLFPRLRCLD